MNDSALSIFHYQALQSSGLGNQGMMATVDWFRLYDSTSFYVTLILRTFIDILYFLLIILILLIYIGNTMYMLHLSEDPDVKNSDIIEPVFGNLLFDSTLNQFNLMIRECKPRVT